MSSTTRYIGWCPVCQHDVKVRGKLVHHGYLRPGVGHIIGDCPGVGFLPYELSTEAAVFYRDRYALPRISAIHDTLRVLTRPGGPPHLTFAHYDIEKRRVIYDQRTRHPETLTLTRAQADDLTAQLPSWEKDRYDWDKRLLIVTANYESDLRMWESERDRMNRLISTWALQPLRTIEEEVRRQEQTRREREAARDLVRNQKIAAEVAKIQKRIDSAIRNRNSSVLADIYKSQKLREVSGYRLSWEEGLALLDRDQIWSAFGLGGSNDRVILDNMGYGGKMTPRPGGGYDLSPLPWPEELGGGYAKRHNW